MKFNSLDRVTMRPIAAYLDAISKPLQVRAPGRGGGGRRHSLLRSLGQRCGEVTFAAQLPIPVGSTGLVMPTSLRSTAVSFMQHGYWLRLLWAPVRYKRSCGCMFALTVRPDSRTSSAASAALGTTPVPDRRTSSGRACTQAGG